MITAPIIDTQPGALELPAGMPEDPGRWLAHGVCGRCFPNLRVGDWVRADCGYVERSFPGFARRRWPWWRRQRPTCLGCVRVANRVAAPACGCRVTGV